MRKNSSFILVLILCFLLTACGKEKVVEEITSPVQRVTVEVDPTEQAVDQAEVYAEALEEAVTEGMDGTVLEEGAVSETTSEEKQVREVLGNENASSENAEEKEAEESSETNASEEEKTEETEAENNDAANATTSGDEASEDVVELLETPIIIDGSDKSGDDASGDGYGRILLVGDSRTVDMFFEEAHEIIGAVQDGITIYCRNGGGYDFMVESINACGQDNFDTLVSWMGCNDFGDFSKYGPYYDQLLTNGKKIVVCTVGPTDDQYLLDDMDWMYYPNENQIKYNNSLVAWANSKGVKVIDLYSYISNSSTITVSTEDGIHYFPQPTKELWNVILKNLK